MYKLHHSNREIIKGGYKYISKDDRKVPFYVMKQSKTGGWILTIPSDNFSKPFIRQRDALFFASSYFTNDTEDTEDNN